MTTRPFHPRLEDLPLILPVFPLPGALLLPEGRLPLNIFEPRYLAMVQDSLGWGRLFGMIQPAEPVAEARFIAGDDEHRVELVPPPEGIEDGHQPKLYATGCAGRIVSFTETEDDRFEIVLVGVCRFQVINEVTGMRGYRRVAANWKPFADDLDPPEDFVLDRLRLMGVLRPFLRLHRLEPDMKALEAASDRALAVSLASALPFEPSEKQALLESPTVAARTELLIALMEMALAGGGGDRDRPIRQ